MQAAEALSGNKRWTAGSVCSATCCLGLYSLLSLTS